MDIEFKLNCPICKTGAYITTDEVAHRCAGCANGWDLDGKPHKSLAHGYRQPGLVTAANAAHHVWKDGHKPGTVTPVWVLRHMLRTG